MESKTTGAKFNFKGYRVTEASMSLGALPISNNLSMNIGYKVDSAPEDKSISLELKCSAWDDLNHLQVAATISGEFEGKDCTNDELNKFAAYNAPAILFPYLRSYISIMTSQSGVQPVLLPTVNLVSIGNDILRQLRSENKIDQNQ